MTEDENPALLAVLPTEANLPDVLVELSLHINSVLEKLHGEPCSYALAYLYGGGELELARMQRLSNCTPEKSVALFHIASKVPYSNPKIFEPS